MGDWRFSLSSAVWSRYSRENVTTNSTSARGASTLGVDSEIDLTSTSKLGSRATTVIVHATSGTAVGQTGTSPEHAENNPGGHDALEVVVYGKLAE
jgi:hypothetical protein